MFKKSILVISFCLLIIGCSPQYKTDYRFQTPWTETGKMCAASCVDRLATCKANCELREKDCERIKELETENLYLQYVEKQKKNDEPILKERWAFQSYRHCSTASCDKECDGVQRICHSNCGGNIVETRRCTAFCD